MDIWNFISTHWRLILEGALVVILFILQLFKKRPVKVVDSIKEKLQFACLIFIQSAERMFKEGSEKKDYVLNSLKEFFYKECPSGDFSYYLNYFIDFIEEVLSTPQKKD